MQIPDYFTFICFQRFAGNMEGAHIKAFNICTLDRERERERERERDLELGMSLAISHYPSPSQNVQPSIGFMLVIV